ncbi:hypothetical protein D3C73_572340 [compost metagenome]
MGFLGLFIGPVLMALVVSIWREWIREVKIADVIEAEQPSDPEVVLAEEDLPPVRKVSGP